MAKYSKEIRTEVVAAIASGETTKGAARRFGVGHNQARKWYRAFIAGGIEQVLSTRMHYTHDFKVQAVEYRRKYHLSYPKAATALGIPADGLLYAWEKIYQRLGIEGLHDTTNENTAKTPKVMDPKNPTYMKCQ